MMDGEGNPLRPGIPYLDNRAGAEVEAIVRAMGGPEEYFRRVGNRPSPSTCTAALIDHILVNEPAVRSGVRKVGYLNTYLAARFTGTAVCDPTTASYSGLLDVRNPYTWGEELIRIAGIDGELLPELEPSYHRTGGLCRTMAVETGLREGIPVIIGSGDTAASAFALGLTRHGEVFESMGTSEVLSFCLDNPDLDGAFMNRSHVMPGLWLCHGAVSTSGGSISWLLKNIFPDVDDVRLLEENACRSKPGANGLLFLPYLAGERSPIFDSAACGAFFGFNLQSTRSDMIRAVYEGPGYAVRQICDRGRNRWGMTPERIKCVGGASGSPLSLQIRADMLGAELECIETENASAYGAAMLGGVGAGIFPDCRSVPFLHTVTGRVVPDPESAKVYGRYFAIYEGLYPRLRDSMHELKRISEE